MGSLVEKRKGISGAGLKWIAILSMLIDHAAAVLIEQGRWVVEPYRPGLVPDILLRLLGRLAFPIFCFLLVEGYLHTRSRAKFLTRLLLFGLVSELPFDLAFSRRLFDWGAQNVYFTLALGLLAMLLWDRITRGDFRGCGWLRRLGALLSLAAMAFLAWLFKTDYGAYGVLLIAALYLFRRMEWLRYLGAGAVLLCCNLMEAAALPDFALFHAYNGERGRQPKYLFYVFYPAHLLCLVLLRRLLFGPGLLRF